MQCASKPLMQLATTLTYSRTWIACMQPCIYKYMLCHRAERSCPLVGNVWATPYAYSTCDPGVTNTLCCTYRTQTRASGITHTRQHSIRMLCRGDALHHPAAHLVLNQQLSPQHMATPCGRGFAGYAAHHKCKLISVHPSSSTKVCMHQVKQCPMPAEGMLAHEPGSQCVCILSAHLPAALRLHPLLLQHRQQQLAPQDPCG